MSKGKNILFLGFVAASLYSISAFASDCSKFSCRFDGGGSDKASWSSHCEVEGSGDDMSVRCADGDDMDQVFRGDFRTHRDGDNLVIRGVGDHDGDSDDNSCTTPRIVIFDMDRDHDDHLAAQMTYTWEGFTYTIPGECHVEF